MITLCYLKVITIAEWFDSPTDFVYCLGVMGPVISDDNKRLILLSVIQLSTVTEIWQCWALRLIKHLIFWLLGRHRDSIRRELHRVKLFSDFVRFCGSQFNQGFVALRTVAGQTEEPLSTTMLTGYKTVFISSFTCTLFWRLKYSFGNEY